MSRHYFCVLWSSNGPPSFGEVLAADSPVSAAAEDGEESHLKPHYPVSPLTSIRAYPAQEPCAHELLP